MRNNPLGVLRDICFNLLLPILRSFKCQFTLQERRTSISLAFFVFRKQHKIMKSVVVTVVVKPSKLIAEVLIRKGRLEKFSKLIA